MTLDECVKEWKSKSRHMGCVSAAAFVCKRVPGFYPERTSRYDENGRYTEHVVATDGQIRIDLAPYADGFSSN